MDEQSIGDDELSQEAESQADSAAAGNIEMLLDIALSVHVRLGDTRMLLRDILKMGPGSVLKLNRNEGDGVEVYVNGKLIAMGQIVQTPEGNIGVEVSSIVTRAERLRSAKG